MGLGWILPLVLFAGCDKELVGYGQGSLKVVVEQGDAWLHDYPLFMGMKKKNAPQVAVWVEDTAGTYLATVYVSHKIATQSWTMAGAAAVQRLCPIGVTPGVYGTPTGFTCRRRTSRCPTVFRELRRAVRST